MQSITLKIKRLLLVAGCVLGASQALAELDPELAAASTAAKNDPGLFATGYLLFGTSQAAGTSRPGPAVLAGGELGYALPRDSWGRLQGSLFAGTGFLNFKAKDEDRADQTVSIGVLPMIRGGYAYSLGHGASFLWQLGAGAFLGRYSAEVNDVTYRSEDALIGLAGSFGGQLLLTPSSWFEIVIGLDWMHYAFDVDDVKGGGVTLAADRSFNVNSPAMSLGLKIRL
jgi:hypothetical protein